MKLLIIGGGGMAGHMLKQYFRLRTSWDVWTIQRSMVAAAAGSSSTIQRDISLDAKDAHALEQLLKSIGPDIVINAVGLLNEDADNRLAEAIYVNSFFPHLLSQYGDTFGFRLIHISTDCVFSGNRGDYCETDISDGCTTYAKTKSLGEVARPPHLTIRTSIIGPEIKKSGIGLFHWFMNQQGEIQGYSDVYWNGVTTLELAKAVEWCIAHPSIHGLVHLAAPKKLSKCELLVMLQVIFAKDDVTIHAYDSPHSDKSLVSTRSDFTYKVPDYPQMLQELKQWMDAYSTGVYGYGKT